MSHMCTHSSFFCHFSSAAGDTYVYANAFANGKKTASFGKNLWNSVKFSNKKICATVEILLFFFRGMIFYSLTRSGDEIEIPVPSRLVTRTVELF